MRCAAEALGVQADVQGMTHVKQPEHMWDGIPLSLHLQQGAQQISENELGMEYKTSHATGSQPYLGSSTYPVNISEWVFIKNEKTHSFSKWNCVFPHQTSKVRHTALERQHLALMSQVSFPSCCLYVRLSTSQAGLHLICRCGVDVPLINEPQVPNQPSFSSISFLLWTMAIYTIFLSKDTGFQIYHQKWILSICFK